MSSCLKDSLIGRGDGVDIDKCRMQTCAAYILLELGLGRSDEMDENRKGLFRQTDRLFQYLLLKKKYSFARMSSTQPRVMYHL